MKKFIIFFFTSILAVNLFAAKNLYLSYLEVPKKVYTNQRFELVIKALVTTSNFTQLDTEFSKSKNIKILNPNSKWEKVSKNIYKNSYYFKVNNSSFSMPNIAVKLYNSSQVIDVSTLSSAKIKYSQIAKGDERFSNIIAKELKLKAYKTKQYTNKEALTIIDIDGLYSNLENFHINGLQEQGISKLKGNYPKQNLVYYFVTPVHQKEQVVTYYNTETKSFKELIIPLILQNELVSTQTDLNPNDSSFEKYKKIAVVVAFVLFLVLFIWKRKKFLLLLTIIFLIISIIYNLPNRNAVVQKGSYIYILPTKNSTIFFKLEQSQNVQLLQERNGFIKVIGIDNQFIGWVKEKSLEEN